jgi:hypothetical protein
VTYLTGKLQAKQQNMSTEAFKSHSDQHLARILKHSVYTAQTVASIRCEKTLTCKDRTYAVVSMPDNTFATAHHTRTQINIWNLESGEMTDSIGRRKDDYTFVWDMCSLSNNKLACASVEHGIKIFDMDDGIVCNTITAPDANAYVGASGHKSIIGFSSETNDFLATAMRNGTCMIFDVSVNGGAVVKTLKGHEDSVFCIETLPKGQIATGSGDETIKIWNVQDETCVTTINAHFEGVLSLCLVGENQLASGGGPEDPVIRIWNIATGENLLELEGHEGAIRHMVSLGGGILASASDDKTVKVWDTTSGKCLTTLTGHRDGVKVVELVYGKIITCANDEEIKIWTI